MPDTEITTESRLLKAADPEKRLVYCVVLEPETFDLQKDAISVEEIEKAAHQYAFDSRVIGLQHEELAPASMVESFLAPIDFEVDGEKVLKGSWVMVIKVNDDGLWQDIKDGKITGLSIGGTGRRVPVDG